MKKCEYLSNSTKISTNTVYCLWFIYIARTNIDMLSILLFQHKYHHQFPFFDKESSTTAEMSQELGILGNKDPLCSKTIVDPPNWMTHYMMESLIISLFYFLLKASGMCSLHFSLYLITFFFSYLSPFGHPLLPVETWPSSLIKACIIRSLIIRLK